VPVTDITTPTQRAEAAYSKAVENGIENVPLFAGALVAAVWLSPWAWLTRAIWTAIALTTVADLLSLLGKFAAFRALQTETTGGMARTLHVGMLVVVFGENALLIALLVWSGFRVW
jgi:hypothetical protein